PPGGARPAARGARPLALRGGVLQGRGRRARPAAARPPRDPGRSALAPLVPARVRARMRERPPQRRRRRPDQPWWQRHRRAEPRLDPRWSSDNLMNDGVRAARRVYEDRDRAYHELLKRRRGRGSKAKGTEPVVYTITRKRSDRSEAHARALAFFVGHCDLDSMHVGAYQKGGLIAF